MERVSSWWEEMAKAKEGIGSVVAQKNRMENNFDRNKMLVAIWGIFWSIFISKFTSTSPEMPGESCGGIKVRQ